MSGLSMQAVNVYVSTTVVVITNVMIVCTVVWMNNVFTRH